MPEDRYHVYAPLDMPDVEVLWEGSWCPGEARMRTRQVDGTFIYQVQFRQPGSTSSRIEDFAGDNIRPDTVDRSRGRA